MNYADATSNSGFATSAAVKPPAEHFIAPLYVGHSAISEVTERLETLANRLCGAVPEPGKSGLQVVNGGGIFDDITGRGRDLIEKAERMTAALQRIERALP